MSIVGVHGVGNYKAGLEPATAAAALGTIWRTRLRENRQLGAIVDDVPINVAYYSHLLRKPGQQGDEESIEALDDDAREAMERWMSLFDDEDDSSDAQGYATWQARRDLSDFARLRGVPRPVMERGAALFFGEVTRYLAAPDDKARCAVRELVGEQLRAAEPPLIVIAHSLGSIVAYETLWQYSDIDVRLLVTLGSPLAMPHVVFPKLDPAAHDNRGARPPGVREWVNYADVGDLVAIPVGGVGESFDGVDDRDVVIHLVDFHRVANYLKAKKVGATLATYLRPAA